MKWLSYLTLFLLLVVASATAQPSLIYQDFTLLENRYYNTLVAQQDTTEGRIGDREFPSPRSVLFKSMMIPGWGQIENRQIWKVPIIYGLFAGVGFYTMYLNDQYQDFRAAFYNSFPENNDFRFGPTPERLEGVSPNELQSNRNSFRNQRDFMFVVFGLAYGLNVLDAYVFAHMRSFDVSDDLSARTTIQPVLMADGNPGISISLSLFKK
jgi:hypothetical protein